MKRWFIACAFTWPKSLRACRNHTFAAIWGGQTLSRIGDGLFQIALAWWILKRTGSAGLMAQLLIVALVPTLCCLLIGGVAVDRYSRLKIMLISDLLRAIVTGVVAGLALCNLLAIWQLYVLNLVFGIVDAFFQPAATAAVPELVDAADLPSANALTSLGNQAARVVGPALGALVIGYGGAELAFILNSFTFLIAAACVLPGLCSPKRILGQAPDQAAPMLAGVAEGLATVRRHPWLWVSMVIMAPSNLLLAGAYSVALPFLVSDNLHAEVGTLSLLYMLFAVGSATGSLIIGRRQLLDHGALIYGGVAVAGLALAVFGLTPLVAALALAAAVNGCALEIGNMTWISALQTRIAPARLGRVISIDMLGSFALVPLGYALAGWATEVYGPACVFLVAGGLTACVAGMGLFVRRAIWMDSTITCIVGQSVETVI